jgi:steroid delta-isomerase-like uncharacterized protein
MPASRELAEKQIAIFNSHDVEAWVNTYAENTTLTDPGYTEPLRGRDAVRKDVQDFWTAFPDMRFRVTNVIVDGDQFSIEGIGTGTNEGPIQTPAGTIDPTHKRVEMKWASVGRVDGSELITEERRYYDQASLFQQLGLTP